MNRRTVDLVTTIFIICNYSMAMVLLGVMYVKVFGAEGLTIETALVLMLTNIGMVFGMFRLRRLGGL